MKLCAAHSMPVCRICNRKEKPAFGTTHSPLKNKKQEQTRMSADATVQTELGERCLLLGFMPGDCGEKVQRCHIVKQETIRDAYKHGACREHGAEFWVPMDRHGNALSTLAQMYQRSDICAYETITLQQILDHSANLVPGCDAHNLDGLVMVEALDKRKAAGLRSYPDGFGQFTHEFRFDFNGSFWHWVPFDAPAVSA